MVVQFVKQVERLAFSQLFVCTTGRVPEEAPSAQASKNLQYRFQRKTGFQDSCGGSIPDEATEGTDPAGKIRFRVEEKLSR